MEEEQKHHKEANSLYGVALAACNSFLQHKHRQFAFDPTSEALVNEWSLQGAALVSSVIGDGFVDLLNAAAVAWQLEQGHGGDAVVLLPSARVLFYPDGPNEEVFDPSPMCRELLEGQVVHLRRRPMRLPDIFHQQKDAFDAADVLPPGFLWVWACDMTKSGTKQYAVASLDDFWEWYASMPAPSVRTFYEVIREGWPVCFHADLEYYTRLKGNEHHNPEDMVRILKELVRQLWLEETGHELDPHKWDLNESCSVEKVSFHLTHPDLAFRNCLVHKEFCRRLEERAPEELFVQKEVRVFFLDQSIYTPNRLFRLVYSTKFGQERFMLPTAMENASSMLNREVWERCLVSLPRAEAVMHPAAALARSSSSSLSAVVRRGGGGGAAAEGTSPFQAALASAIEKHFKPDSMRDVTLEDSGVWTFSMVNHDCNEICHDRHNNQVYAVADLKLRVFYAKCHADRSKKGPDHSFPQTLAGLSIVDGPGQLQPGGMGHIWTFPAVSTSAQRVLRFCKAIFGSGGVQDRIPEPGSCAVTFDSREFQYVVSLGACASDGGHLQLFLNRATACIRCAGGEGRCSRQGWRLERPSRSSTLHGKWDLSFILPRSLPEGALSALAFGAGGGGGGEEEEEQGGEQEAFLAEPNFYKALGFKESGTGTEDLYKHRIGFIEQWAKNAQANATPDMRNESGIYELAARIEHKVSIMQRILLDEKNEMAYRECLMIDPAFAYPLNLLPKGPVLLLVALWVHLAKNKGYKRVGDEFYIPTTVADANVVRTYYKPIKLDQLLTRVCSFDRTPNLCALMWSSRTTGDMERMLRDENHWPPLPPSKRYLGFRNVVYDLEQNTTLTWEEAGKDPNVMPFNCLDQDLPLEVLEMAKRNCPLVQVVLDGTTKIVRFVPQGQGPWVETPLFDKPQRDQGFDDDVLHWYYGLFGRMFHLVGKTDGDNWEICPSSQGAPGTFKSSTISVLQSYVQPTQYGVIATKTEKCFPISAMQGKFMVFLTETGGCDLDKELLKQMTCGDPLTVAIKFKMAAILSNWDIPMWFAGNSFLGCRDTDGSLERRFAVFPHTRILRQGQGDTGLVKRIIRQEQALILIKCNTLYLAMKASIKEPIHDMLPKLIQDATSEALMQNDSLRSYMTQLYVCAPKRRVLWSAVWDKYVAWCRKFGHSPYAADPHTPEVQTMINKLGGHFRTHQGELWLANMRERTKDDPPYMSVFQVKAMTDPSAKGKEEEEEEEEDDFDQWLS
jgi:hypothetical protein